jgi:integrase/recombinase XerD
MEFLGAVHVEDVTIHDLRRYVVSQKNQTELWADHPMRETQKGHLSSFTIASRVQTMKRLFQWSQDEGLIEENPAHRIRRLNPKHKPPKAIKQENFMALLKTTEPNQPIDLRDRAILFTLADTGCRVGGLCSLRVQDLNLDENLAIVTEKGGKTRFLHFTSITKEALEDWLAVRPKDRGDSLWVGCGTKKSNGFSPSGVNSMLRRRKAEAGIEGIVNPHAFRHAFAREFLLNGGDLGTLSDLMGHSSVEVTKSYYAIFTVNELREKHHKHSPVANIFKEDDEND